MDRIDALLDQVVEVCPLPATTQRVLALTSSEKSKLAEVASVISTDPALAAAVLSVANSAAYAANKVDSLDMAVMRLGLRELNNLAAAMALFATFRSKAELTLQLHELCVASGSIAHGVAKKTQAAPPSTAFVCGLLCEIGAMACLVFDGKEYVRLWQQASGDVRKRVELERERYGVSSFVIGQRFLERNSLPPTVSLAIGADLTQEPHLAEPLGKVTLLARHAPTVIALGVGHPDQLRAGLSELANQVDLPKLDGEVLFDICAKVGSFLSSS